MVMANFNMLFMLRRNIISHLQQDGEMAEAYIMELCTLANNCIYGDRCDEMICDRLVVGIWDTAFSRNLQLKPELTLEKEFGNKKQLENSKES